MTTHAAADLWPAPHATDPVQATVSLPGSKSLTNRALVLGALEARLEDIREPMDVSVIGCKVNGPGEAKEADIGVVGASPRSLVYRNGEKSHLIDTNQLVDEIETMVRQRVSELEEAKSKEIIRSSS